MKSLDNWVKLADAAGVATIEPQMLAEDIPTNWSFLVKGPATIYQPTTAQPFGELLKPFRTTRQSQGKEGTSCADERPPPVGPAILVNHVGQGIVLTLAGSPDFATASEHHIVEARRLLRNAVRFLDPTPRLKVTAPANVESVVTDDPATRTLASTCWPTIRRRKPPRPSTGPMSCPASSRMLPSIAWWKRG